jgi:tetratricopeptide (TPR) repeat protein
MAIAKGNLAEKLLMAGRLDEAREAASVALACARSIGDSETIADVFRTMGRIRLESGDSDAALRAALQAAALYEEMGSPLEQAMCLEVAVDALKRKGEMARAEALIGDLEAEMDRPRPTSADL